MPNQNITQRRTASNVSASEILPITNNDVNTQSRSRRTASNGFSISPLYDRTSITRWLAVIVLSMVIGLLVWKPTLSFFGIRKIHNKHQISRHNAAQRSRSLPSELAYALENSELVALYLAASWCPMSTPVSLSLDEAFGESDSILSTQGGGGRKPLSIVYVSSDKSIEQYNEYLQNRNWLAIPFESSQRNDLKRHFATCARRELLELGIDRKHEIPTIIVIDSQTHGVITTNGAEDVEQMGEQSLEHWQDMQRWIRKAATDMT